MKTILSTQPTHLLQKAERIPLSPLPAFNNATVLQAMDPDAGHANRFAGRGDTQKFTTVGAGDTEAGDNFIPFGD